ncbi:putative tail tube protein [Campylobacter phage PC5]|nr:gp19 tail tube protein [Campylobacter phage NCTC12673]YP_006908102.1 putative tail tube protein [Campylobacter phage CP30A]YP_009321692.1 putative tail tube protein [Campylobacter phage PC14]YP_009597263.1 putative tail tube protein [Campylobacter phage vB_CjeM_Los1]ANH51279.1 putative tail tube protein [Campylobacter phage PC5]AVR55731.1 tail tube protein [Campylobacter phage CP39]QPX63088.1 putative tail tube protein [Campylobacter phage F336]QPX63597.1 putative tail tube protein [Campy
MPLYTVDKLANALKGGAKSDKYFIEIGTPLGAPEVAFTEEDIILCKTASFPERTLGEVEAFVQGRKLKLPGDSTFDAAWSPVFYQTPDHNIRAKFLTWIDKIDVYKNNYHTCDPYSLMVTAKVHQVNCNGEPVATYEFFNVWPSKVGEIEVAADKTNSIQEFTVDFTYSHWEKIA